MQRDGSLAALDVPAVQNAAANSGAALMMVVTNIENGRFSDTLGEVILNDMQVQNRLLDEIQKTKKGSWILGDIRRNQLTCLFDQHLKAATFKITFDEAVKISMISVKIGIILH